MKKVLIISPVSLLHENSCGVSKTIFNLIKNNENCNFSVISPYSKSKSEIEDLIKYKYFHFKNKYLCYFNKLFPTNYLVQLELILIKKYLINEFRDYDVIHLFSYKMLPLLNKINSNLRSKTIVSLVDSEPRLYEKYSLCGKNFLLKLIYIFISNQSKKLERILLNYNIPLHFVSNVDGDYFKKQHYHFNENNLNIIQNGVNSKIFFPIVKDYDNKKIIFFGNLNYKPNYQALEFICKVSKLLEQFEFHIIGKFQIKSRMISIKNIIFRGYVDDLNFEINDSNIAIFPIFFGTGIKNKVLESFATGIKVIATEIATEGIPLPNNCKIVNSNDPKIWAKTIEIFAKEKIKSQSFVPYTWDNYQYKFNKIYHKISNDKVF